MWRSSGVVPLQAAQLLANGEGAAGGGTEIAIW